MSTTAIKLNTEEYIKMIQGELAKKFGSPFLSPKLYKITINVGVGNKYDKKKKEEIVNYIEKITGQKPKKIYTKISISNFKLRKGDLTGVLVTLRGKKMYDFLLYLIYIVLPRTRDFKGTPLKAFDKNQKTYSLGIRQSAIFPVVGFGADIDFGVQINLTFQKSSPDNLSFLKIINFPIEKTE